MRTRPGTARLVRVTWLSLAVIALVGLTHFPALDTKALLVDDAQYLTNNYLVQNPSLHSAETFLREVRAPSTVDGYYQPLTMISLMLDSAAGGGPENLRPFRRTSLLLHLANTALVLFLLYALFGNPWTAAAAALLFGLHPMAVEPINWVGERKTLLAAFFALFSLVAYAQYAGASLRARSGNPARPRIGGRFRLWYGLALVGYLLALLAKPTSTPLPLLLLLLDFWPLRRLGWRSLLEKVPFFLVGAVSAAITVVSQGQSGTLAAPTEFSIWRAPLTLCHNIVFYLSRILLPLDLTPHIPYPEPFALSNPRVLAGVIGTVVLLSALVFSLRRTRAFATGWAVFFIAIFPTMGVLTFTNVIAADKYAYLPAIGLLLVLAWGLVGLGGRSGTRSDERSDGGPPGRAVGVRRWMPRTARVLILTAVVFGIAGTEIRATRSYLVEWRDSESLFRRMLRYAPDEPILHNYLGKNLLLAGRSVEAREEFEKAIALNPGYAWGHSNLGVILNQDGRLEEAEGRFREAIRLYPGLAEAQFNLGNLCARGGRVDEAEDHFRQTLEANPYYVRAYTHLARLLRTAGRSGEAEEWLTAAGRRMPEESELHAELGMLYFESGRMDEASRELETALELHPENAGALNQYGLLRGGQGQMDEAKALFRRAIRVQPDHAAAHNNLGVALARHGRIDSARVEFEEALRLRPEYQDARLNLERCGDASRSVPTEE